MDDRTLAAYAAAAPTYAAEWNAQPPPEDMYALLREYFRKGPTLDVGCGAGRDTAWLVANGFDARGIDASEPLLAQARAAHPGITFKTAALPELHGVDHGRTQNVLCETVIMHLEPAQVTPATRALLALLRPSGTLYLSWRVTAGESKRDAAGRLYAAFDATAVTDALTIDDRVLFDQQSVSASSGKTVHRLIVRRLPRDDPAR